MPQALEGGLMVRSPLRGLDSPQSRSSGWFPSGTYHILYGYISERATPFPVPPTGRQSALPGQSLGCCGPVITAARRVRCVAHRGAAWALVRNVRARHRLDLFLQSEPANTAPRQAGREAGRQIERYVGGWV